MIAKRSREDEHDKQVTLVWIGDALRRQKKLPGLKTLLSKRQQQTRQNHKQMSTMLHQIAENYGLKIRTRKKARRG